MFSCGGGGGAVTFERIKHVVDRLLDVQSFPNRILQTIKRSRRGRLVLRPVPTPTRLCRSRSLKCRSLFASHSFTPTPCPPSHSPARASREWLRVCQSDLRVRRIGESWRHLSGRSWLRSEEGLSRMNRLWGWRHHGVCLSSARVVWGIGVSIRSGGDTGRQFNATPRVQNVNRLITKMSGYPNNEMEKRVNLLTSAPCSTNSFTTRSFPPDETAWNCNKPSRTEFIGCPVESAYLTRRCYQTYVRDWELDV